MSYWEVTKLIVFYPVAGVIVGSVIFAVADQIFLRKIVDRAGSKL